MKLQSKLALFNAASKLMVAVIFVLLLPEISRYAAQLNTDYRLGQAKERVLELIREQGISEFLDPDQSGSFGSYNILKEEFISLEQVPPHEPFTSIENSPRLVEGEVVNYRVLSHYLRIGNSHYLLEIGRSYLNMKQSEWVLQRFAIALLLALVLLTVFFDIAFTRLLIRPLRTLIKTKLSSVNTPASFDYTALRTTTDDFRLLDESINDMMHRIQNAFAQERDVIANVSHELLTPVSVVQSKLENMLSEGRLSDEDMQRLEDCQRSLARLRGIIRSLLLISRVENEQYLKDEQVNLRELLLEVLEELEIRLEEKNVRVQLEVKEDFTIEKANRSLLFTMLANLLGNAIKYNMPGGEITISGHPHQGRYRLQISDTGPGIEPEHLPHIFDRFRRFSSKNSEGHGLGLSIAKTIAAFHRIDLMASSTPGVGTTIELLF